VSLLSFVVLVVVVVLDSLPFAVLKGLGFAATVACITQRVL